MPNTGYLVVLIVNLPNGKRLQTTTNIYIPYEYLMSFIHQKFYKFSVFKALNYSHTFPGLKGMF